MRRLGIVWRPDGPTTPVADIVMRNVRGGTLAELVEAAVASDLDGDLVDDDGRFEGRILSTPGLVPLIVLADSP